MTLTREPNASPTIPPTTLDTVLLKVASRCNLDCRYCYLYHMGDEGWREQPKLMPLSVVESAARSLAAQLALQGTPFSVILHGGEPLLLGARRLEQFCNTLRTALPQPCGLHLQTNGLLLSDAVLDILVRFRVGISISLDGPPHTHDQFRTDRHGRGSYAMVAAAIERVTARDDARPLFAGLLAVIDPTSDPCEVYSALKSTGTPAVDFLVRDGNWDRLPHGKSSPGSVEYGSWLSALLTVYLSDKTPPRVRILDDMLRIIMGGKAQKEGVGTTDYGILVIEPNGQLNKNDTLKVAHPRADNFPEQWSITTHCLDAFLGSDAYQEYYRQQRPTSPVCLSCQDLYVCGGGMVAHRWSASRGFDNPTVFCADQRYLINRMRRVTKHLLPLATD